MTPYQYLIISSLCFLLLPYRPVLAGDYLNAAHGSSSYGVNRSSTATLGYAQGNCAHCHEQHASIGGEEPVPVGGEASDYLLFDTNQTSQTENFCFDCHQNGGISLNKSYSYNFGGYTSVGSYDSNIKDSFSHAIAGPGSSHHLPDFVSQVLGQPMQNADGVAWSLPADINPCDACHNPHLAQRNVNSPYDATKSAISRPSDHDNRWGDDAAERMNAAYSDYLSPYWWGSTNYEPDNSATSDGSNLPNYVRLCTDCHNDYNTINSTNPRLPGSPRNINKISWKSVGVTPDAHGELDGITIGGALLPPYTSGPNMTLCCTDCHEPHGSPNNIYLLRSSINKAAISVPDTSDASWQSFCFTVCHTDRVDHHDLEDKKCVECHYHGKGPGGF
jgi:predicted CXXCH cytochrome family protein